MMKNSLSFLIPKSQPLGILITAVVAIPCFIIIIVLYPHYGTELIPLVLVPILASAWSLEWRAAAASILSVLAVTFLTNTVMASVTVALQQLFSVGALISVFSAVIVGMMRTLVTRSTQQSMILAEERAVLQREVSERQLAEAEVKRLNADLERRVNLRTAELAQANEELHKEVAERQQAEADLRESQQRLQLALNAANAGAWSWDMLTNQIVWSDENYRLLGLQPFTVVPNYDRWLACVHPEDRERADEQVSDAVNNRSNLDIEVRVVWPDGSIRWLNDIGQIRFDETGEPEGMHGIQMDITERKQIEAEVRASLHEKEVLLKEIHHRVKNNLQVIASILNLQSTYLADTQMQAVLQESQNRVAAMAAIHEKLYQSKNLARIDFGDYIRDLTTQLLSSYTGSNHPVQLEIAVEDIWLGVNTAVPCGLILNELVSNALKHAFPAGWADGRVKVAFHRIAADQVCLCVADNGVGMPPGIDPQQTDSLGLQLVTTLARQIDGRLEIENGQETACRVTFPNHPQGTAQ
jgi:PAS domain S-box-containing protein